VSSGRAYVEFGPRAEKDIRQLGRSRELPSIRRALAALHEIPLPANLDIKPLSGSHPWSRLRVGVHRVIFRALSPDEMADRRSIQLTEAETGYTVARVVHRSQLDETIGRLR
jgi:mRNA-degrading endonuclease RelE of RelBE toxin-antitoxin system